MKMIAITNTLRNTSMMAGFGLLTMMGAIQPASSQFVDSQYYYKLTTQFRGNGMCLDVYNGGAKNNMTHLTGCADFSGQYWKFTPAGNGYYRLSTMFRGANMCLDIHNGGSLNNQPHLTTCANYSGQFWQVRPEGGWVRLTTQFRGTGMCLDIFNGGANNNQPHLTGCANLSGQFWQLTATNKRT